MFSVYSVVSISCLSTFHVYVVECTQIKELVLTSDLGDVCLIHQSSLSGQGVSHMSQSPLTDDGVSCMSQSFQSSSLPSSSTRDTWNPCT